MPVTVQLPGFNRNVPLENLANIANAATGAYKNVKSGELADQEMETKTLSNDRAKKLYTDMLNPLSPVSESSRNSALGTLGAIAQSKAAQNPDSKVGLANLADMVKNGVVKTDPQTGEATKQPLNAVEINNIFSENSFVKDMNNQMAAQTKADSMAPIGQARMESVNNQKDKISQSAGDLIDKNPIMIKINKQRQQIDIDKHTLQSSGGQIPVGMINEIQQGIANAISGGGSAGLGKTEQIEINNANTRLTKVLQGLSPGVQYVNDPELVNYLSAQLDRLGQAYDNNAYSTAQRIREGRLQGFKSNPAAAQVLQDKVESFKPPAASGGKAAPGGHATVIQNGHTFTWNPQTGSYE